MKQGPQRDGIGCVAAAWQKAAADHAEADGVLMHAGVDILTFGQYLQPTPKHLDVTEFVTPEKFEHWRRYGEEVIGFRYSCLAS